MKRLVACLLALSVLFTAAPVFAYGEEPRYEGGIANEQDYHEVVFITGQPIVFSGKVKTTTTKGKDGSVQSKYTYTLENAAFKAKLNRSIQLTTKYEPKLDQRQTVGVTGLDKFSETVSVGKDRYKLEDYQFHQSILTDHRPAVDYFSGNWDGRKTYSLNNTQGTVTVETTGDTVGYDHYWGATETQRISQTITYDLNRTVAKEVYRTQGTGTVELTVSFSRTKDLSYIPNDPTPISFTGGYLLTEQGESVLRYNYDLPAMDANGIFSARERNADQGEDRLATLPTQRRLPVVQLYDIRGHWAEADIAKLYGLEAVESEGSYFGPSYPMRRAEFAKAVAVVTNMVETAPPATPQARTASSKPAPPPAASFSDVPNTDKYFKYVEAVSKEGVIKGVSGKQFFPDGKLTRAQAVTILVRALGLEGMAPDPRYQHTAYLDDAAIPAWARDAVYVASEIGLLRGDAYGYVLPNQEMTKAEAAALLTRFIDYLQHDLKLEYRERIINY